MNNPNTVNDCDPSQTCRSTDDNIFRQVRLAGGTARSYVEGATSGCSEDGNAAKHIPALYYYGTYTDATGIHNDHDFCNTEVRPYSGVRRQQLADLRVDHPGHTATTATIARTASSMRGRRTNIQRVLDSAAYRAGTVAVFVWYDEDHPVPNAQSRPRRTRGTSPRRGIGTHAALLKTIEDLLGLPLMTQGQLPGATNLRSVLGM